MTDLEARPHRPMEFRYASDMEVRFAERQIELVAVPYDAEAHVQVGGRWITESVAPGSFDGVERRATRIKVNRDHDVTRTVGRTLSLHPSRAEGLVAVLRIGRSPLGDETLEYANDNILDASVGFAPFPGGEQYLENRSRRRITKAFLGHIALVPESAYDAPVLSVRNSSTPDRALVDTPNLDLLRHARLEEEWAGLRSTAHRV